MVTMMSRRSVPKLPDLSDNSDDLALRLDGIALYTDRDGPPGGHLLTSRTPRNVGVSLSPRRQTHRGQLAVIKISPRNDGQDGWQVSPRGKQKGGGATNRKGQISMIDLQSLTAPRKELNHRSDRKEAADWMKPKRPTFLPPLDISHLNSKDVSPESETPQTPRFEEDYTPTNSPDRTQNTRHNRQSRTGEQESPRRGNNRQSHTIEDGSPRRGNNRQSHTIEDGSPRRGYNRQSHTVEDGSPRRGYNRLSHTVLTNSPNRGHHISQQNFSNFETPRYPKSQVHIDMQMLFNSKPEPTPADRGRLLSRGSRPKKQSNKYQHMDDNAPDDESSPIPPIPRGNQHLRNSSVGKQRVAVDRLNPVTPRDTNLEFDEDNEDSGSSGEENANGLKAPRDVRIFHRETLPFKTNKDKSHKKSDDSGIMGKKLLNRKTDGKKVLRFQVETDMVHGKRRDPYRKQARLLMERDEEQNDEGLTSEDDHDFNFSRPSTAKTDEWLPVEGEQVEESYHETVERWWDNSK